METGSRGGIGWFWVGVFIAAQLADLATTAASLNLGGVEANPLVLGLIAGKGLGGYAAVKLLAIGVGVGLLYLAGWMRRWLPDSLAILVSRLLVIGLQLGVAVQLLAVLANLIALGGEVRA
jgi:hypothetical protein